MDFAFETVGDYCQRMREVVSRQQAQITRLETLLKATADTAEFWINRAMVPDMCESDYRTWLALGLHSKALTDAAAYWKETGR